MIAPPQPGFEPGTPVKELAFEASAIPDYATEAQKLVTIADLKPYGQRNAYNLQFRGLS